VTTSVKYFADFVENASRVPKQIPRGLVRMVGEDDHDSTFLMYDHRDHRSTAYARFA